MADKLLKTLDFGTGDVYHLAPDWKNVQNIPEDIGGGGGGGPVDWEDVQNRPFGDIWNATLIDNQTFEYIESEGAYFLSENALLTDGNRYEIVINGEVYADTASFIDAAGMTYIGNPIIFGLPNNDMSFACISAAGMGTMLVLADGSTSPVTIALREGVLKKIDPIYVEPAKTCYFSLASNYLYHDKQCKGAKVTANELLEALTRGMPMFSYNGTAFYAPMTIQYLGSYVMVEIYGASSGGGMGTYYTAEYTG